MKGFVVVGYDWEQARGNLDDEGKFFIQNKYPIGKLLVRTPTGFVGSPITNRRSVCVVYRSLTADELSMFQMLHPELGLEE